MALISSSQMLSNAAKPKKQAAQKVTPEEEAGLSSKLANKAIGGLAAFGNFLSLPQSMVMDTINLQNPLDQLLTPFSGENRTSGKDLLRNLKLIGDKDTLGNTLAGIAVDIATDPLTYLTLGASATTKGGQAAKAIGVMDDAVIAATNKIATQSGKTAAELTGKIGRRQAGMVATLNDVKASLAKQGVERAQAFETNLSKYAQKQGYKSHVEFLAKHGDEPLRGTAGVGLPFMGNQMVVGTGETAQKFAANVDQFANAISGSSTVRTVKQLFHSPAMGQATKGGQMLGGNIYRERQIAVPIARGTVYDFSQRLNGLSNEFSQSVMAHPGIASNARMIGADAAETAAKQRSTLDDFARFYHEANYTTDTIDQALESYFNLPSGSANGLVTKDFAKNLQDTTQSIIAKQDEAFRDAIRHGINVDEVQDIDGMFQYNGRHVDTNRFTDSLSNMRSGRFAPLSADFMKSRNEILKYAPVAIIEDAMSRAHGPNGMLSNQVFAQAIARESQLLGRALTQGELDAVRGAVHASAARETAGRWAQSGRLDPSKLIIKDQNGAPQLVQLFHPETNAVITTPEEWADAIQQVFYGLPRSVKERVRNGGAMYRSYLRGLDGYMQGSLKVVGSARAILDTLAETGVNVASKMDVPDVSAKTSELLGESVKAFKAATGNVAPSADDMVAIHNAAYNQALRNSKSYIPLDQAIAEIKFSLPDNAKQMLVSKMNLANVDSLKDVLVPTDIVASARSLLKLHTNPEEWSLFRSLVDGATKFIKENLTLPFPSFFSRNAISSIIGMNYLSGEVENLDDVSNMLKSIKKMHEIRKNPALDPERVRDYYVHQISNYGYAGDVALQRTASHDIFPPSAMDYKQTLNEAKSVPPLTLFDRTPDVISLTADKLAPAFSPQSAGIVKDVTDKSKSIFERARARVRIGREFALRTGEKANAQAEMLARGGLFNFLIDYKGYTPAEAAARVRAVHVDYNDLSAFERVYAKNVFPFYTFARKQLTETLSTLSQHPGGAMATTIKSINRLRDPNGLTPDYVAETASIPLWDSASGDKQYLTGFGLSFEDPLSFFGKGIRGAGLEALSRMNPMIKGPTEYFTGQTFFQTTPEGGRSLQDTDPVIGRLLANVTGKDRPYRLDPLMESVASNSPLSRYLTTARTLTDTRKDAFSKLLNLATGVRVSTISPEAADAVLREKATSALRESGGKAFVRAYLPDYEKQYMSPTELKDAQDLEALLNTLADRARKRKAAKQAAGK